MNKKESIGKRLTASFLKVATIMAAVAIVTVISLVIISNQYSTALENYGFAQGDIGRAMYQFAEARSSLRAAIGFDDETAIQNAVKKYNECRAAYEEAFAEVEKTVITKEGRETYDAITAELPAFWEEADEVIEIGAVTDRARCLQAQEIAINSLMGKFSSIYEKMEKLLDVKEESGDQLSMTLSIISWVLTGVIIVVIAIAMVICMKLGKRIARGIVDPLKELGDRLNTFATGDLTSPFPNAQTGDEVEEMETDAVRMANNLNLIIGDIGEVLGEMASGNYAVSSKNAERYTGDFKQLYDSMSRLKGQMSETLISIGEASNQVSAGSEDLANAAQGLAEGSTDQANAVQEIHATILDITATMEKSAEKAGDSYVKAQEYANEADESREEMNAMIAAMQRINDASMRIGNIISEIEDIASQTNLLSLNASIEAARAGESGRGFAVVADQIRELADQSAQAANDTRELIEGSIKEVTEGNHAAERAAESLESILGGIQEIAEFSKSLKVMVEDEAEAMRQAEIGVDQISGVVQSNAAIAEEASATSEELSAQATVLDELIGQFELK